MAEHRTAEKWMSLITECRQSGLTDMDWCRANGISKSTFYKAVKRLRDKACVLPASVASSDTCSDLTSSNKQDVVPISILPDDQAHIPDVPPACHSPYAMEINSGSLTVRISNDISPCMQTQTLRILGGFL